MEVERDGPDPSGEITRLLLAASSGVDGASDRLYERVYGELRKAARRCLKRLPPNGTLQPTALVHEVYMKLVRGAGCNWENRAHFFGLAGRAMRDILVDRARRMSSRKGGGGRKRVELEDVEDQKAMGIDEIIAVSEALDRLREEDETAAEIVLLRFFSGLTGDETALALNVSPSTVDRHWLYARAWLHRELHPGG